MLPGTSLNVPGGHTWGKVRWPRVVAQLHRAHKSLVVGMTASRCVRKWQMKTKGQALSYRHQASRVHCSTDHGAYRCAAVPLFADGLDLGAPRLPLMGAEPNTGRVEQLRANLVAGSSL